MSKTQVIDRAAAVALVERANGSRIFKVVFRKRSTGKFRKMVCRKGVTKHLKGGPRAYDPKAYNLLCVFDMQKSAYRNVNLETLHVIRMEGVNYRVTV